MIGPVCPVCGGECGFREIDPYYREVRELWPRRSGLVPVARFQCRGKGVKFPTFSLLPYQLVPYFKYTVESMVQVLLMWREFWKAPRRPGTSYGVAVELDEAVHGESGVTSWQLTCWALVFQGWLRRAQSEQSRWYDFSSVEFHARPPSILDELYGYFEALSRGPPVFGGAVAACVREHAERTGRFLFGVPSQGR